MRKNTGGGGVKITRPEISTPNISIRLWFINDDPDWKLSNNRGTLVLAGSAIAGAIGVGDTIVGGAIDAVVGAVVSPQLH